MNGDGYKVPFFVWVALISLFGLGIILAAWGWG
jgi:hypothetical protein